MIMAVPRARIAYPPGVLVRRGERSVRLRAPAKVNLWLEVLGKRPDGYHEIETLMHTVDLADEIELRLLAEPGLQFACEPEVCPAAENLAFRAARTVLERSGEAASAGLSVRLRKRIPAGGGLGGGSSDAAATLLGACDLLGFRPEPETLRDWAAELGADVPFFLTGGAAWCRGRGDRVEPLAPRAGFWVLVHAPGLAVSTTGVYRALRLSGGARPGAAARAAWAGATFAGLEQTMFNRLEETALERHPALRAAQKRLTEATGRPFRLSGSGSSLFAVFEKHEEAENALHALESGGIGPLFLLPTLGSLEIRSGKE